MKFKLRPVFSATLFCLSAASLVLAAGCAAPVDAENSALVDAASLPNAPFSCTICLVGENDVRLHVGDSLSVAQEAFPKPKRSFSITSVPPEFEEKYQVYGWENPGRSFAVLTQRGAVALALDINERVDDSFIDGRVKATIEAFGTPTATTEAGDVKYWFWEDGLSRAMLCVAIDTHKRKTLSQAVGYTNLMDYMRMSPNAAREDGEKAVRNLFNGKS